MLNWVFLVLIATSVLMAAFTGRMNELGLAGLNSAKTSVEIAIGLIGQMALWMGLMRILQQAGLMRSIGNALTPVLKRLFPDVPSDHPAMGAMIMNMAANMAGLGNAATPFGLKAMKELNRLNQYPGVATNAMALFLAINTSGLAVLPLGVIATRATLGSQSPASIIVPSLLATAMTTVLAVIITKTLQRLPQYAPSKFASPDAEATASTDTTVSGLDKAEEVAVVGQPITPGRRLALLGVFAVLIAGLALQFFGWRLEVPAEKDVATQSLAFVQTGVDRSLLQFVQWVFSDWLIPLLMFAIVLFGIGRQVKVYEAFIAGAREAFQIATSIIPYLVAILVAVGMFRASGAMTAVSKLLDPALSPLGLSPNILLMGFLRPLSGNGAFAFMSEVMKTNGPDSLIGYTVSVMNGSTETTFYVLAVYFGTVQVKAVRHTLAACLTADVIGLMAAVFLSRLFFVPLA